MKIRSNNNTNIHFWCVFSREGARKRLPKSPILVNTSFGKCSQAPALLNKPLVLCILLMLKKILLPYNAALLGKGYIFLLWEEYILSGASALSNGRNSGSQFSVRLQENVTGFRKTAVQTVWYDPEMAEEGDFQLWLSDVPQHHSRSCLIANDIILQQLPLCLII